MACSRLWTRIPSHPCRRLFSPIIQHRSFNVDELPRRPARVPFWGLALLVVPAGFALGTIYYESESKNRRGELREEAGNSLAELVDLPLDLETVSQMNFRPVRIRGRFEHDKEVYIVNTPKRTGLEGIEWNLFHKFLTDPICEDLHDDKKLFYHEPGHHVVTPFVLSSDNKTRILVDRGWVPLDKKDPATRKAGQVEGEVELTGYLRTTDQAADFFKKRKSRPEEGNFSYRDIKAMAEKLGTLPIYVDLDRESTIPGGPIGGQTWLEKIDDYEFLSYAYMSGVVSTGVIWYMKFIGPVHLRKP